MYRSWRKCDRGIETVNRCLVFPLNKIHFYTCIRTLFHEISEQLWRNYLPRIHTQNFHNLTGSGYKYRWILLSIRQKHYIFLIRNNIVFLKIDTCFTHLVVWKKKNVKTLTDNKVRANGVAFREKSRVYIYRQTLRFVAILLTIIFQIFAFNWQ